MSRPAHVDVGSSSSSKPRRGVGVSCTTEALRYRLQDGTDMCCSDLEECCNHAITRLEASCTGKDCVCQVVPRLVWIYEEQQESCYSDLGGVLAMNVHIQLLQLATNLLNGGHSSRAFRRTTEAFEM